MSIYILPLLFLIIPALLVAQRANARYLVLLFSLLAGLTHAQAVSISTYIDSQLPINNTRQIGAQNVRNASKAFLNNFSSVPYTGQISTSFPIIGNGGSLTIIPTSQTTALSAADILSGKGRVFNILSNGAVPDGYLDSSGRAMGTDNRLAIQSALDNGGKTYPVGVYAPCGNWTVGSNGAINTEPALKIPSNTVLFGDPDCTWFIHNINPGPGALISTPNEAETDTGDRVENVTVENIGIMFPTRHTVIKTRKGVNLAHVDGFRLAGLRTSGTDIGSFNTTIWSATNGLISGNYIDAGDSTGEDGLHFIGNVDRVAVVNNVILAGDDALSFTQEDADNIGNVIQNIVVDNNVLYSTGFSSVKMHTVNGAVSSSIRNITLTNNCLGRTGKGGKLITLTRDAVSSSIADITFGNTKCGDMSTGAANVPAVEISGTTNLDLGDIQIKNTVGRGIYLDRTSGTTIGPKAYIGPYISQSTVLSGIELSGTTFLGTRSVQLAVSGTANLALVNVNTDYIDVTGFSNPLNNGRFSISSVSNTAQTINITSPQSRSSAQNESNANALGTIVRRQKNSGLAIHLSGAMNTRILDSVIDNPAGNGIRMQLDGSGTVRPSNTLISGNTFLNVQQEAGLRVSAGYNTRVINNRCINSTGMQCILEDDVADTDYNEFFGNTEVSSTSMTKESFYLSRISSRKNNNYGTNSTKLAGGAIVVSGTTSVTIPAPFNIYAKTIAADVSPDIIITPITGLGSVVNYWTTYNNTTRNFSLNVSPTANTDVRFNYKIEPYQ